MGLTWLTPTAITPGSADSWQDCDVSGSVPSGATGVLLHIVNTNTSTNYAVGWRKNGSTDARTGNVVANYHCWVAVGVDASRLLELYVGSTSAVDVYLIGYFDSDAAFFTNAPDKSLGTADAWTDIDISGDTGGNTAIGAVLELTTTSASYGYGFRKNGSTDNRTTGSLRHTCVFIGVDGSEVCEGRVGATSHGIYLTGYLTGGASFATNATEVPPAEAGGWNDCAPLQSGASGAFLEFVTDQAQRVFGARTDGSSEDIRGYSRLHTWAAPQAAYGIVEAYIGDLSTDVYLVGIATGGPAVQRATAAVSGAGSASPAGARFRPGAAQVSGAGQQSAIGARYRPGAAAIGGVATATPVSARFRPGAAVVSGAAAAMLSGARYRSGAAQIAAGGALSPTARAVLPALAKCFAAADLDATPQAAFLASARCDGLADLLARFGLAPWGATLFLDVTTRPACADSSVRADCRPTHPTVAVSLASDRAIFEDATRTITPHVAAEP